MVMGLHPTCSLPCTRPRALALSTHMNPDLQRLLPYPFERLAQLSPAVCRRRNSRTSTLDRRAATHAAAFVADALISHMQGLSNYPLTRGSDALRGAIAKLAGAAFRFTDDQHRCARHILPVNGTREALFAFAKRSSIARAIHSWSCPNRSIRSMKAPRSSPREPWFQNTTADTGYRPDFGPYRRKFGNVVIDLHLHARQSSGAVLENDALQQLIALADQYDFVIASDECYSELYPDEGNPPTGLLAAAAALDARIIVAAWCSTACPNVPTCPAYVPASLRDAEIMAEFLRYRTYHGCAMPPATQAASACAWQDETHVRGQSRAVPAEVHRYARYPR